MQIYAFAPHYFQDVVLFAKKANVYQPTAVDKGLIMTNEDMLIGFITWRTMLDEVELLGVAVSAYYRKQGLGLKLLKAGINAWQQKNITQAFLEVRDSNRAARSLYKKCNFIEVGRRRNYYHQPEEDAVIMSRQFS